MADTIWYLQLVCCGRDDGVETFDSWEAADAAREAYTSGTGVAEHGYSASPAEWGHQRAAILRLAA